MSEEIFFDLSEDSLGREQSQKATRSIGIHADDARQLGDMDGASARDILKEAELNGDLESGELVVSGKESAEKGLGSIDQQEKIVGGFVDRVLQLFVLARGLETGVDDWGVCFEGRFDLLVLAQLLHHLISSALNVFGELEEH